MVIEWWIEQIKKQFETKHLPEIQEYLRIPSISATGEGIQETAEMTAKTLTNIGASNIQIVSTKGWPVVYGELIQDPQKPTVLFYSMYDVQPVEPEKWVVPPFDGAIVEDFEGMGGHTGLHIETPATGIGYDKSYPLIAVPIDKLVYVDAYVLQIPHEKLPIKDGKPCITLADIKEAEKEEIPEGAIILIGTGYGKN